MGLLKFILANEKDLLHLPNIFTVAHQVVNIFNLFITFGDTFLPDPASYDDLYYELIRVGASFDELYDLGI
jgi:hypothetical protein